MALDDPGLVVGALELQQRQAQLLDGGEALGRPVGVALDQTGALLVADDVGNRIWRVTVADRRAQE